MILLLVVVALPNPLGCKKPSSRPMQAYVPSDKVEPRLDLAGERREQEKADDAAPAPAELNADAISRKIIYTAELRLTVEDFAQAAQTLEKQVRDHKGYIAQQQVAGTPGSPRSGTWTVRIPEGQFDSFRSAVSKVGELASSTIQSREVTEEFVDLNARLDSKQKARERYEKHLQDKTGKLEDIIKVEEQLERVVEEMERIKGRLRLINDLVALTTVTVVLEERTRYVPEEAAGFGTEIARTFGDSLSSLLEFGQNVTLLFVAIIPWLPFLLLVGIPIWHVWRRAVNSKASKPQTVDSATPAAPSV
jgi:hypothetical protein